MAAHNSAPQAEDLDRQARIAQLRAEIAAGTYETPEKISAAVDAFLACAEGDDSGKANPDARRRPR